MKKKLNFYNKRNSGQVIHCSSATIRRRIYLKMQSFSKFRYLLITNICILLYGILTFPVKLYFEYFFYKNPDYFRGPNNPSKHRKSVESVQAQIYEWIKNGRQGKLCSSRKGWLQVSLRNTSEQKKIYHQIDVDLGDIIEIDTKSKVLFVEPRMTMGTLTYKLLNSGWTIPVVPECEELTVGGLICGAGLETSSHKYGLFYNSCLEFEVVLPNGEIVNCSKKENSDLFYALPMSNCTIGFLTGVKIPLIPAKKYVELSYHSATTLEATLGLLSDTTHEFVEGFQFDKNKYVVTYGDFADSVPNVKVRTFLSWFDPFFHADTEKQFTKIKRSTPVSQLIPLRDYYHRHTKGGFWVVPNLVPIFSYDWGVKLFGWLLPYRTYMLKLILESFTPLRMDAFINKVQELDGIGQDYVVPLKSSRKILDVLQDKLEVYPIWFCPTKMMTNPGLIKVMNNTETMYLDIGAYGFGKKVLGTENCKELRKTLEQITLDLDGFVGFYIDTFISRDQFYQMFDHKLYLEVRKKYNCDDAFPLVYDKVKSTGPGYKSKDS